MLDGGTPKGAWLTGETGEPEAGSAVVLAAGGNGDGVPGPETEGAGVGEAAGKPGVHAANVAVPTPAATSAANDLRLRPPVWHMRARPS